MKPSETVLKILKRRRRAVNAGIGAWLSAPKYFMNVKPEDRIRQERKPRGINHWTDTQAVMTT